VNVIRTFLVFAALGLAASAQPKSAAVVEQRFFNIEDAVQHRADLSDAELSALASDDLMRSQLHLDGPAPKLTQDGLEAAEVHLCGAGERDLVVIGYGSQFAGANVGPFWIIRDLKTGPAVVLSEISLGLTIDTKRSNKCLNIEAIAATANQATTAEFRFNGEKYIASQQKSAKSAQ
jgi:hypothetical protein